MSVLSRMVSPQGEEAASGALSSSDHRKHSPAVRPDPSQITSTTCQEIRSGDVRVPWRFLKGGRFFARDGERSAIGTRLHGQAWRVDGGQRPRQGLHKTLPLDSSEWRNLRKINHEHLFSRQSLGNSRGLRHKNVQLLLDDVQKFCDIGHAVNIREALLTSSVNFMSATLFLSDVMFDSRGISEFPEIVSGVINFAKEYNYADFLPILKSFDPLGKKRILDLYHGRLLRLIKIHIDQRVEFRRANPNAPKHTDFLETLIDISQGSDSFLTLKDIPYLLFDLYLATDTTIRSGERVMTELLRHPDILSKVKDEVRSVVGDRKIIEDEEISRLPYLEAVLKESFRYHPVSHHVPRMSVQDWEINGYFIPKGTFVSVQVWAINGDPSIWHNPDSFDPDRFLNKNIDLKGQCFEFIPFRSGKRICPGMPLALLEISSKVAALIHNFNWKFAPGESERNGTVISGDILRREAPLMAIPLKYD